MRHAFLASLVFAGPAVVVAAEAASPAVLTTVLGQPRIEGTTIEPIYNEAILRDGTVDRAVTQLSAFGADEKRAHIFRTNALLVASHLQWRFGKMPAAMELVDRAIAIESTAALTMQKARLFEAMGKLPEARQWYEQTQALATDPEDKEEATMRLTFLVTDAQNVDALVKLAKTRDREFRNRAAVALAILNHPGEAADLYEVFGEGSQRQRQHLRLAQWAVQAHQTQKAQGEAWEAVQGATLPRDIRYSLSVLIEAHELDESWDKLLAKFAAQPSLGPDAKSARVDVLHRLKRYNEAIVLIESDREHGMSREGQRRLLRMYGEAGLHEKLEAEFRNLIAKEPAELAWARGLSEYFLEQGRRDEAAQLWREFTQHNDAVEVLLEGAQNMAQQGLDELALAAADRCATVHPDSVAEVMWFRYEHYLKRGQLAKVEEVLRQLEKDLPPDSPRRSDVADAYERVKNPRRSLAIWEELAKREGGLGNEEMMHLAWLYDIVGQRDKSLAVWKKLWESEVSDTRRKLVEDRLLLLAAEAGGIGDIAIPIEEKIAKGTASPREAALLVRIYTDANDPASAIEVIQESFKRREKSPAMEIASLREQAKVYQALNRFGPFIAVTEKLLKFDPENGSEYLQSLILTHVERGGKQDVEILQKRLTELRKYSAAAGDEFEAGVLVMAGFKDKGIDSYRRALARNPGSSDNYLLLADLLKQDRRTDQGLAILQYFAEIAPGDDGFMVAIDGILNLRPDPNSAVLRWAHRRVLERITRHADKFYLYDLSSELAEESRDMKTYLLSLENSLVEAGPRRSTVLRELISATEERQPGSAAGMPDARRNLAYSRRLIAMGEEMPPEVYLNLGRAFLKMDNPDEALNAFNLAIDRTDRSSLVEESADRFEAAGYTAEAKVLYEKALTADATNIPVMAKLAASRSRDGAVALANGLYFRAMLQLIEQQPLEIEPPTPGQPRRVSGPDSDFTFLYRRFYGYMQSGLLFTLPTESTAQPPQFALIEAAFDKTLQEVLKRAGGTTTRPLATYPRLSVLAKLARMTGLHTGRYDFADEIDLKLLKYFGSDARTVNELVTQRLGWGLRASAEKLRTAAGVSAPLQSSLATRINTAAPLAPLTDLKAAAQQALTQKNFELAADTALAIGDKASAFSAFQDWVNSARSGRGGGARPASGTIISAASSPMIISTINGVMILGSSSSASGGGNLVRAAAAARRKLEPERFNELCRQIVELAASNPDVAREMVTTPPSASILSVLSQNSTPERSTLFNIEEAAGKKLFTEEKLSSMIAALDSRQLTTIDMDYVLSCLPVAERGPLYLRQIQAYPSSVSYPSREIAGLSALLTKPVDAESKKQILSLLKDRIQRASKLSPYAIRSISSYLSSLANSLAKTFDQTNADFLNDLDRHLAEAYHDAFPTPVFATLAQAKPGAAGVSLQSIIDNVVRDLAQLPPDYPASSYSYYIRRAFTPYMDEIYPKRKAEFLALLEKKAQEAGLTPTLFAIMLAVYQSDPAGDLPETVAWLESVKSRAPSKRNYLDVLYPLYRQLGESAKERETLEALIAAAPEVENYRRMLAMLWRNLDHPTNALNALGGQVKPGMFPDENQTAMVQMFYIGTRTAQFNKIVAELAKPELGSEVRPAFRSLLQMLPAAGVQLYQYYQNGFPVIDYADLFAITSGPRPNRNSAGAGVTIPLRAIETEDSETGELARPIKLMDRLAAQPFALPDLEAAVRTLDPSAADTNDQYLFYPLVAEAYANNGRAASEFARLMAAVRADQAGKKDLLVWMELAMKQPPESIADLPALAEKALLASGPPSDYQRIQLARLYARTGEAEKAVGMYHVLAASLMAGQNLRSSRGDGAPLFSAMGLVGDAEKYLDRDGFARLLAPLAQITKPYGSPALDLWHQRFLLWLAERAFKANVPADQVRMLIANIDPAKARREDLVRYTQAQSRLVSVEQALPALKIALRKGAELQQSVSITITDANMSRYLAGLGIRSVSSGSLNAFGSSALPLFKAIFPTRPEAWPNAREWVVGAARAIPGWIKAAEVDADTAVQVLALVTLRESQMGLPEAVASARELSRLLGQFERVSIPTATMAVAVAEKVGAPVELAVVRKLVASCRLDVRQIAGLVHRTSETEGAAAAITLGETALAYTQNDELLRELESLAQKSGSAEQSVRFKSIREQAENARAMLASPKNPAAPVRVSSLN